MGILKDISEFFLEVDEEEDFKKEVNKMGKKYYDDTNDKSDLKSDELFTDDEDDDLFEDEEPKKSVKSVEEVLALSGELSKFVDTLDNLGDDLVLWYIAIRLNPKFNKIPDALVIKLLKKYS